MAEQPKSSGKTVSDELASKLEKRPTAQQAGVNNKLAPTLQATAKKLQTEQKKDIVHQNLKTRPPPNEVGVDTSIAPSIQPTAKTLRHKIRRDSLKHSLQAQPDIQELIDSGILKPFSSKLAASLQLDACKLEEALAGQVSRQYLQEIGILDPYKKNVISDHIDIEAASGLLLRALVYRRSYDGIKHTEKGSGTQFGFNTDIAPSIQQTAKHLDVQQKKDKLSAALTNRPSPRGVMDKQVRQLGYDSKAAPSLQQTIKDLGREMIKDTLTQLLKSRQQDACDEKTDEKSQLAPRLQGIANKLAMEQKKDTLSQALATRSDAQDLIDKGILKAYAHSLANRLQLNADMLEKQLAIRVNAEYLKQIGILEPYKKHVDVTSILQNLDIESKANLILNSLILKHKQQRDRRDSGGDKAEIAPCLQATVKKLEKQKTVDILKKKLKHKPDNIPYTDDSVAPSLQATKKKLETAQKKDTISKTLATRQDSPPYDLTISAAIQSIAKSLESKMRRDSLSSKMSARPDIHELIDSGILKPFSNKLAASLQLDACKLEEALAGQVSKAYLQQIGILDPYKKHVDRESIDIEKASGLLLRALVKKPSMKNVVKTQTTAFGFSDIAPTLQQTAKDLDVQQKKDKLSAALEKRPAVKGVMEKQVGQLGYDIRAAPSLQQTIKDLGREMLKDVLEKALRERPTAQDVACVGVDVKNAPAIQSAMHDLAAAQKRDSVSKGIKNRPSAKEVGVDTQLARGLQGIAKTLEMELKTDQVKQNLVNLGIIKKTKIRSVIATIDQCIQFIDDYEL